MDLNGPVRHWGEVVVLQLPHFLPVVLSDADVFLSVTLLPLLVVLLEVFFTIVFCTKGSGCPRFVSLLRACVEGVIEEVLGFLSRFIV